MQSFGNGGGAKAIFGTSFVFMMNESGHGFVIETIILRERGIRRIHQTHIDWCRWVAMMNQACTFFRQRTSRVVKLHTDSKTLQKLWIWEMMTWEITQGRNTRINYLFWFFKILDLRLVITTAYSTEKISKLSCRACDCLWNMIMVLSNSNTDDKFRIPTDCQPPRLTHPPKRMSVK